MKNIMRTHSLIWLIPSNLTYTYAGRFECHDAIKGNKETDIPTFELQERPREEEI